MGASMMVLPMSALTPRAEGAAAIATLWWVMLAGACVLWLGVVLLFAWTARQRATTLSQRPERWLFWGAGVLPVFVLVPLVAYGLVVGERTVRAPGVSSSAALQVRAVARQWAWRFEYPTLRPGVPQPELVLPAGRPVRIEIVSDDVIHSLWVPSLGGKLDAIPGHVNVMVLQGLQPGRYRGLCAEFCGTGHSVMRFEVLVEPAEAFARRFPAAGS